MIRLLRKLVILGIAGFFGLLIQAELKANDNLNCDNDQAQCSWTDHLKGDQSKEYDGRCDGYSAYKMKCNSASSFVNCGSTGGGTTAGQDHLWCSCTNWGTSRGKAKIVVTCYDE